MVTKEKQELRAKAHQILNSLSKKEIIEKSQKIINQFLISEAFEKSKSICIYVSLSKEAFTHDLIRQLLNGKEKIIIVPFVEQNRMGICQINDFSDLEMGKFNILEPKRKLGFEEPISLIIIPSIAFDEQGNRLGRGKGYYDRFLKDNLALKIALAFEEQIVDEVPTEGHDIKMDFIITDKRTINCKNKNEINEV